MLRGIQSTLPTPGKKRKHYIAGALNARGGRVEWTEYERKNSVLFLGLLHQIRRTYRSARRITLIADNYIIHKSEVVNRWLSKNRKFRMLFQLAYHPRVNEIDEPSERGESDSGPTPTKTVLAALIGCTNVIGPKCAQRLGIDIGHLNISSVSWF